MNTSTRFASLAALATVAAIACGSAGALAADEYVTHSVKVSFADLNLGTQAGAATLYQRIRSAARAVCSPDRGERPIERYRDWQSCYQTAVSNAVSKVNNPLLTALHGSKTLAHGTRVASTARPENK